MMWRRRQLVVWWLISAASVAGVTAWLALRWHVRTRHESASHPASWNHTHEWLRTHLTLSAEQTRSLEQVAAAAEKEIEAERGSVLTAEKELAEALQSGDEKSPGLQSALQKLSEARRRLQDAAVRHYYAVARNLSEEQRRAYAAWYTAQFAPP